MELVDWIREACDRLEACDKDASRWRAWRMSGEEGIEPEEYDAIADEMLRKGKADDK